MFFKNPNQKKSFFLYSSIAIFIVGIICSTILSSNQAWLINSHLLLASFCFFIFIFNGGALNIRVLGNSIKNKIYSFLQILFIILIFIFGYSIIREHFNLIYDPTENKAYSLSSDTKKIISKISKDINIKVFSLGGIVPKEISDTLDKYLRESSKISLKIIDPDKNATLVEALGISEKDTIYISFQDDESLGIKVSKLINEDSVTNGIRKLLSGKPTKLYAVSGHNEGDFWDKTEAGFIFLKEALEGEGYQISKIILSDINKLDPNTSCLIIASPKNSFLPLELENLNNFINTGGKIVSLLEQDSSQELITYFENLGFKLPNSLIVGKEMINFKEAQLGVQPIVDQYSKHQSVNNFKQSIILSTVRPIQKKEMSDDITELAFSSEDSWGETNLVDLISKSPKAVKEVSDIYGPVSVAAAKEDNKTKSRIVLLGDADFLANINIRQLFNKDFILNLVNWATGDDNPVVIRASTLRQSQKVISPETFNILFLILGIILPEAIILFGIFLWSKRQ